MMYETAASHLLTTAEVAKQLGLTPRAVRDRIERRKMQPVRKIGNTMMWTGAQVREIEAIKAAGRPTGSAISPRTLDTPPSAALGTP